MVMGVEVPLGAVYCSGRSHICYCRPYLFAHKLMCNMKIRVSQGMLKQVLWCHMPLLLLDPCSILTSTSVDDIAAFMDSTCQQLASPLNIACQAEHLSFDSVRMLPKDCCISTGLHFLSANICCSWILNLLGFVTCRPDLISYCQHHGII